MLKYINEQLANKRVIVRVDYNVPIEDGKVKDDTRIVESKQTLEYLLSLNCDIILLTHLGRPKTDQDKQKYTTRTILNYLNETNFFGRKVNFISNFEESVNYVGGKIYLFENVRFFEGETKNSLSLAKEFSKFGDVFVNDAFGSLHRVHSSVAGISAFLPTFFGFLVKKEIENLSKFLNPDKSFTIILGGAKITDKLGLIKNVKADKIVIGGAMALSIYRKHGKNIGNSFFEEIEDISYFVGNPKILLPELFVVVDENYQNPSVKHIDQISSGIVVDSILGDDIIDSIVSSGMVFWNGPMGIFEKGFVDGSVKVLESMAKVKGFRAIGGGDTVRFLNKYKKDDCVDFVSTGGGATLEFLEKGTLDAIEYIKEQERVGR